MKYLADGTLSVGYDADCLATREILDRVGDKWSVFAIVSLEDGPKRHSVLKRTLHGISQRVLTSTLRGLERDGLVVRRSFPTNPPQVEYELTPLGRTLSEPVRVLAMWAHGHRAEVLQAREAFDQP